MLDIIDAVLGSKSSLEISNSLKHCLVVLESKSASKREFLNALNANLLHKGGFHRFTDIFNKSVDSLHKVYIHNIYLSYAN